MAYHATNFCKYYVMKRDMYGKGRCYCVHKDRVSLNPGIINRILSFVFGAFDHCPAAPGYAKYCPLYEQKNIQRPAAPPPMHPKDL